MPVGMGYDIHRLKKGRKCLLGGVHIPYAQGPAGHSDADVLLHAICDALLGAAGDGDLGTHFPGTQAFKGISSLTLLDRVASRLRKRALTIEHIDTVVVAERPRLGPYRNRIQKSIAKCLRITPRKVSVKATTNEGLGLVGKEKAIAAFAIASLKRRKSGGKKR